MRFYKCRLCSMRFRGSITVPARLWEFVKGEGGGGRGQEESKGEQCTHTSTYPHAHTHSPGIRSPRKALQHFLTPVSKAVEPVGGWKSSCAPLAVGRGGQICTALWRSCFLPGVIQNNLNNCFSGRELLPELPLKKKTNFPRARWWWKGLKIWCRLGEEEEASCGCHLLAFGREHAWREGEGGLTPPWVSPVSGVWMWDPLPWPI